MGLGTATNTHRLYNTVSHEHLDSLVNWARRDFPSSGLNLVECADGRWFVEVDYGDEFDLLDGLSKPHQAPYVEPQFFAERDLALEFAFECIRSVYPDLRGFDLASYWSGD